VTAQRGKRHQRPLYPRHGRVGIDDAALHRAEPMLHQERSLTHLPQGDPTAQLREEIALVADRESNSAAASSSPATARRPRASPNPTGALGRAHLLESDAPTERRSDTLCSTATLETRRRGELPRRLEPSRHSQVRKDRPRLVHHEEEATAARRRTATARGDRRAANAACNQAWRTPSGHPAQQRNTTRRDRGRQVERQIEADGGRSVEHPAEVAVHQPAQLQRDVPPVFEKVPLLGTQRAGASAVGSGGFDDHGRWEPQHPCRLRQGHAQAARSREPVPGRDRRWPTRRAIPSSDVRGVGRSARAVVVRPDPAD